MLTGICLSAAKKKKKKTSQLASFHPIHPFHQIDTQCLLLLLLLHYRLIDRNSFFFTVYQIEWEGNWIRVYRPDVECTNGIIHVIDAVLLKDSDVRVTGTASATSVASHLIMILVAKWLL